MLRAKCALRAVSGQIFIFQGSLRAHFIRHRRFPCLGHIFWLSGQISGQSTDNTILNWHRRFPCLGHIQGTQGTQGRFFDITFIKIQKLKFIKFEMSVILSFLKMWQKITLSHTMFHYAQLHKKHHFCQFVWGDTEVHFQISPNVLYETIFNLHSFQK